jgi:hypothetical protein
MNGYILLHSRRRLAPTARLRVHLCVHRCGDLDRQRVAFAALDRLAPDGARFLRSRGPATRSVPMALARQLAKHCRHGYWSQRSLLCVKVTATRSQTGVEKGLRGSDRHRPCGEDAHRELGQMSCGRRELASRPSTSRLCSSRAAAYPEIVPLRRKPSCRRLDRPVRHRVAQWKESPRPQSPWPCRNPIYG